MGKMKPRYEVNPFMDNLGKYILPKDTVKKIKTGDTYTNTNTGDTFNSMIIEKSSKFQDFGDFIKLKKTRESLSALTDMSPASYKLFFWIIDKLAYDDDTITIYGPAVQLELGYKSINSVYKAIDGLIQVGVLAPKAGGPWIFYINPCILYRGNIVPRYFAYKENMKAVMINNAIENNDKVVIPGGFSLYADSGDNLAEMQDEFQVRQYQEGR